MVELNAAGILLALALTAFTGQGRLERRELGALAVSAVAALALLGWLGSASVATLAFGVAVAAAGALARPHWWLLPPLAAGACAAAWSMVLHVQGSPWPPAVVVPGTVAFAAIVLVNRRRSFVSPEMRDEALLLVGSFAVLLALGPGVIGGWRSAVALTAEPLAGQTGAVGPLLGTLGVACVLLGGAYTMWKRR